jgi:hypothetical protein
MKQLGSARLDSRYKPWPNAIHTKLSPIKVSNKTGGHRAVNGMTDCAPLRQARLPVMNNQRSRIGDVRQYLSVCSS